MIKFEMHIDKELTFFSCRINKTTEILAFTFMELLAELKQTHNLDFYIHLN